MRTVRMKVSIPPFIKNQRLTVVDERKDGLYLKGMGLSDPMKWQDVVVSGPFKEDDVYEYVPDPPKPTIADKINAIWP